MPPAPVSIADSMIQLAVRLGGMEQALRSNVSHEKLTTILNDHRRELAGQMRDLETHLRGTLDSHSAKNDKRQAELTQAQDRRITDLFSSLDRMLAEKVGGAVRDAMNMRDEQEERARKEIDNKAKDAARGIRLFAQTMPPLVTGIVVAGGFIAWMWATGKI